MHKRMRCLDDFNVWRKGLELAEELQKVIDDLSARDSDERIGLMRKATLSVPACLAEGFMMSNRRDTKVSFYGALNSLEELRNCLALTEQSGYVHGERIQKIKSDISELNKLIGELIRPI